MEHRWLFVSSSTALTGATPDLERIRPLIRAIDAQGAVLDFGHPEPDQRRAQAVGLTAREVAVLLLVARGLTAMTIANHLHISPRTVSKHQQNIYRKLDAGDRLTAVTRAQQLGVLPGPRLETGQLKVRCVEAEVFHHPRADRDPRRSAPPCEGNWGIGASSALDAKGSGK
jgi:DNA-binding CsgD family transcriptional regulator